MVEIARSFSFKKNLGDYQMADFFASAKKEVKESEAEAISEALYSFARAEVIKSVNAFMAEGKKKPEPKEESLSEEMMRKDMPPFKQGRSKEEKQDLKGETRDNVMRDAVEEEIN